MKTIILISILLLLLIQGIRAENYDSENPPKIGLVLSGGAAKGLAHIGVLKVLEEVGITPDYITGTSMGAVIGSLYALGYSADEIAEMTRTADWDFLLSDRLPLNKVAFEEKEDYERFITGLPLCEKRIQLPSGMIQGQQLEKLFAKLMWPLETNIDFDSLPIPFHCMSTDLLSGRLVEISSGNLAEAVRASMAIPSIFSPVDLDTMLLVDGGTIRSFPVEEARKMGADIIIGVYVSFEEQPSKEDISSLPGVLSRSAFLSAINDSRIQSDNVDILIVPDLHDCGPGDFKKAVHFEELGRKAALAQKSQLESLRDSLSSVSGCHDKKGVPDQITLRSIRVENYSGYISDRFVKAHAGFDEGDQVSEADLSIAIDRIYGTRYFQKVSYSLIKQGQGTYDLLLKVKETPRAYLNFAGQYSNQYKPELILNLTLRNYVLAETKTTVSLNISEDPDIYFDVNKYFGKRQRLMKTVFVHWNLYDNYLYEEGIDVGSYSMNALKAGVGGKYSFAVNQQTGVCLLYEKHLITPQPNLKNFFNTMSFERYQYEAFAIEVSYHVNTLNDKYFPKSGAKIDFWHRHYFKPNIRFTIDPEEKEIVNDVVRFRETGGDFSMSYFDFEQYASLMNTITFHAGITIGNSTDPSIGMGSFVIGGLHTDRRSHYIPFAGKNFAEDVLTSFVILKSGIDIKVLPNTYLSAKLNLLNYSEKLTTLVKTTDENILVEFSKGYCTGVKINTFIGPVSAMVGSNDQDNRLNWYLNFGYSF